MRSNFLISLFFLHTIKTVKVAALAIFVVLAVLIITSGEAFVLTSKEAVSKSILVQYQSKDSIKVIKVADDKSYTSVLQEYNQDPEVEFAEPNYLYRASVIPSDTHFDKQWYLKKIKADKAWDINRESPSVVIAIIDSGIQANHIDLSSNIWNNSKEIPRNNKDDDGNGFVDDYRGWNFVDNNSNPSPNFSGEHFGSGILHGTLIAGVAAAVGNNGSGVAGVTWNVSIMPLKVLNDKGEGRTSQVVRAIDYAIDNGADIINLSFVGLNYSQALQEAIDRANAKGIMVVAAAGNEKDQGGGYDLDSNPMYPVCHDGVIGVGATDTLDQKTSFSSYGLKCVDISAPGESIFGLSVYNPKEKINNISLNKHYDGYWSGTSMAAPMISGTLALIENSNPSLSQNQVKDILFNSSNNINRLNPEYIGQLGRGRVDVYEAVLRSSNLLQNKQPRLLVTPASNHTGEIKFLDADRNLKNNFLVYDENFTGGVNVAAGDIDGDGVDEVITGAGSGGGPHIRVFDKNGNIQSQFFAYNSHFQGGVNVAAGDIDGDGIDEVITGAGPGGGPHIRVFDKNGNIQSQFFAYNSHFQGGVNVAAGDIDGDGVDEVIAGAGPGGGPHVRVFTNTGQVVTQFFGFSKHFQGGVNVVAADIDGGVSRNKDEIIIAPGESGGPQLRIFNNYAQLINQFFVYSNDFTGGVNLGAGDINKDGVDEIITGAGPGGGPHVRVFDGRGVLLDSLYGFDRDFGGGVNVGMASF